MEVAIARLEEKVDRILEKIESQEAHNEKFYETRDEVNRMKASAKGAWWMLGILGTMVSAVVASVVGFFIHK